MKVIIIILQAILNLVQEANKELELFKKFQIAAQANPKLTYVDFCNNIKNKEV